MSLDEIRNQKALALLELKEAEDKLQNLEKQRSGLVYRLREFANSIDSDKGDLENFRDLSWQLAHDLIQGIAEARKQLAAAKEKAKQFGL